MPKSPPLVVTIPYTTFGFWWLVAWAIRIILFGAVVAIAIPIALLYLVGIGGRKIWLAIHDRKS